MDGVDGEDRTTEGMVALAVFTESSHTIDDAAFAMVGFLYAGAAVGRITGILFNNASSKQSWAYFSAEAVLAIYLLVANL